MRKLSRKLIKSFQINCYAILQRYKLNWTIFKNMFVNSTNHWILGFLSSADPKISQSK